MGYSGMTTTIADHTVAATGLMYPAIAAFIGSVGGFITGSCTSTCILLGKLHEIAVGRGGRWKAYHPGHSLRCEAREQCAGIECIREYGESVSTVRDRVYVVAFVSESTDSGAYRSTADPHTPACFFSRYEIASCPYQEGKELFPGGIRHSIRKDMAYDVLRFVCKLS
jgi:hypothetical protein